MTGFTDEERIAAEYMLREMSEQKLQVKKRPTDTGYVRDVISHNPWWYSELCEAHKNVRTNGRWKRPRTFIKRVQVVRSLRRIASGHHVTGVYADRLRVSMASYIDLNGPMIVAESTCDQAPF